LEESDDEIFEKLNEIDDKKGLLKDDLKEG
jgi:hypothetical protein